MPPVPCCSLSVRVTLSEYDHIRTVASSLGLSVNRFIRSRILDAYPSPATPATEGASGHEHECSGAPASVAS